MTGCAWCTGGPIEPCDDCLADMALPWDKRPCPTCGRPLGASFRNDPNVVVCHYCGDVWDLLRLLANYREAAPDMAVYIEATYWPEGAPA